VRPTSCARKKFFLEERQEYGYLLFFARFLQPRQPSRDEFPPSEKQGLAKFFDFEFFTGPGGAKQVFFLHPRGRRRFRRQVTERAPPVLPPAVGTDAAALVSTDATACSPINPAAGGPATRATDAAAPVSTPATDAATPVSTDAAAFAPAAATAALPVPTAPATPATGVATPVLTDAAAVALAAAIAATTALATPAIDVATPVSTDAAAVALATATVPTAPATPAIDVATPVSTDAAVLATSVPTVAAGLDWIVACDAYFRASLQLIVMGRSPCLTELLESCLSECK
jgi:hypothetical protein